MATETRNFVMLVGRVGKDPVVNATRTGTKVANLIVCTDEEIHDHSGVRVKANWHDVVAWGHLADYVKERVYRGMLCMIIGTLETDCRDDKEVPGRKLYKSKVKATTLRILDTHEKPDEHSA
jgi:single stranded DNA-binding protein